MKGEKWNKVITRVPFRGWRGKATRQKMSKLISDLVTTPGAFWIEENPVYKPPQALCSVFMSFGALCAFLLPTELHVVQNTLNQASSFFFLMSVVLNFGCTGSLWQCVQYKGFSCCGTRALEHSLSMWRGLNCPESCGILVPRPGTKPTSPLLEGGFLTTGPPGKSPFNQFGWAFLLVLLVCLSWSFRNLIFYMQRFLWCSLRWSFSFIYRKRLEKELATDSSILAWKIPWTEKTAGLQSIGSQMSQKGLNLTQQWHRKGWLVAAIPWELQQWVLTCKLTVILAVPLGSQSFSCSLCAKNRSSNSTCMS